ncbi:MAG: hypothetical protein ACLFVX_03080 [Archaeoglobaceae archaeon]
MKWEIEKHNWSGFREGFKKTSNVSTLTAFTEDAIAVMLAWENQRLLIGESLPVPMKHMLN